MPPSSLRAPELDLIEYQQPHRVNTISPPSQPETVVRLRRLKNHRILEPSLKSQRHPRPQVQTGGETNKAITLRQLAIFDSAIFDR